jgi:P-type Ca2+ transporter type 2C
MVTASFPGTIPLALNVRQIIAIDLGTDLIPALALGMEKPEPDVMKQPPRSRGTRLIDNGLIVRSFFWLGLIETLLCYTGFFSVYLFSGNARQLGLPWLDQLPYPPFFKLPLTFDQASIMAVTVFHAGVVMSQAGNAFACRSRKLRNTRLGWVSNKYLLFGVLVEIIGIVIIIHNETLAGYFGHVGIPLRYWAGLATFPLILYSLDWIRKQIVRKMGARTN